MAKTLPKPLFSDMVEHYDKDSISVHDCPTIYTKDEGSRTVSVNTCAIRLSEGLVLALGLVPSRTKISQLARRGDGRQFLLGPYGYEANLCPHGCGRGARDVANFLRQEWGKPTHMFKAQLEDEPPAELSGKTGIVSFIKIPTYSGQGHMDVWNKTACIGHGYWTSQDIWFWELE